MLVSFQNSEIYRCSIHSIQDTSSDHGHLNHCFLIDPETNEKSFPFKEEFEAFKVQAKSEIKNLIIKEISALKEATIHSNIDAAFGKAQLEGFYPEQLRFMNQESRISRSGIFIVNFEHISNLVLVFLLLTLNM